jgi:sulfonate transport system substrate-binding protein
MKMKRLAQPLLGALAATLIAGAALAADLPAAIRFGGVGGGFGKPFGYGLIAIAQVKGFVDDEFKEKPVKLSWTYFTGTGPEINEALANGQLDFAQYGSLPGIIARANGVPTRIVAAGGGSNIYLVARTGLPIETIQDLKGRKVTFQKATIHHWAFLKLLGANGLTERDATIVDLQGPDQMAAIAGGGVDAAVGSQKILNLRDQGFVRVLWSSKGTPQAVGPNQFIVTESFEKKYPEATGRVVRGIVKAAHWLANEDNRAEAIEIWSKSGIPIAALTEDIAGIPLRAQFDPLLDDFFRWQYRDSIAFTKSQKLIRAELDADKWIEAKYLTAALDSLGLDGFWPNRSSEGVATH